MATGMGMALALRGLATAKPQAKYVIWSRIDQKSCFKAIIFAGFIPIVIDCILQRNGELTTNLSGIIEAISKYDPHNILAIITTTSCFAPRQPDRVDEVSRVCAQRGVAHVVNNAYGLQCPDISRLINRAAAVGRLDIGGSSIV
jgi:O-phospho-L-seryl-tRNASec:L-selenocysteinyl-tRNA synthase